MKRVWCCAGAFCALLIHGICLYADESDTYSSVKDLEKARKQRAMSGQTIWWERLVPGRMEEKKRYAEELKASKSAPRQSADSKDEARPRANDVNSRQIELNKALRREAVCQRLREIAEETNDPELAKQAELLESRSWAVYEQKLTTAKLNKFTPMTEEDVEAKLTKSFRKESSSSARAEANADGIRSIRSEKKE